MLDRRDFLSTIAAGAAIIGAAPGQTARALAEEKKAGLQLRSPYRFGAYKYKVQLHCHTTNSDGKHSPQWLMQAFEKLGFAAVAITDHDGLHRERPYTPDLKDPGSHNIIHIPGVEYSYNNDNASWGHMLGINVKSIHRADGAGNRQAQIRQAKIEGGLTYIAHPIIPRRLGWTDEELLSVDGYTGVEIFNSWPQDEEIFQNRDVDYLLSHGRTPFLIATADYHHTEERLEGGFVVINSDVKPEALTAGEIIAKLKSGNYFSAGRMNTTCPYPPYFTDIAANGDVITVKTDKPCRIEFITDRFNYYRDGENAAQVGHAVQTAQYTVCPDDKFVRIKATYSQDGKESYAWSNPIFVARRR
jgi:hypothetical protein